MDIIGTGKIGRNVSITKCYGTRNKEGDGVDSAEMQDFAIGIYGCYDCLRATKFLRKKLQDKSILINKAEIVTKYCSMPLDKFVKLSVVSEDN